MLIRPSLQHAFPLNRSPLPYIDVPIELRPERVSDLSGPMQSLCDEFGLYPYALLDKDLVTYGRSYEAAVVAALMGIQPGVRTGV